MAQHFRVPRKMSFAALALMAVCGVHAVNAQISIIVAKSSTQTATKEQAKEYFSGVQFAWPNGAKIQVVDQAESDRGKAFYESFVGKSVHQVRLQWTKLVLSGQAVGPKKAGDDAAVVKMVAEDPNAIGYVASSAVDGSVKEIVRVP
jgi:ABC-type phosphate transport system substrate-binding protein